VAKILVSKGYTMVKALDLVGQKFGKLTVIKRFGSKNEKALWECRCSCKDAIVCYTTSSQLTTGKVRSCGCLRRETTSKLAKSMMVHGLSNTRIHNIWQGMLDRCNNPNSPSYFRYGNKGIKVCERWLDFNNFFEDMKIPEDGMQLDRIDNLGNYEPSNCRWATRVQQARNKSSNLLFTIDGVTHCLVEWCEIYKINYDLVKIRTRRYNWEILRALTTPKRIQDGSHSNISKDAKSESREYSTWKAMKSRCLNPNNSFYKNYGARGIIICPSWIESFDNFLADMGTRPPKTTIERIDINKGYFPENCCWSDRKSQSMNKTNTTKVVVEDVEVSLIELCNKLGVKYQTAYTRLKNGHSLDKILSSNNLITNELLICQQIN